MPSDGETWFDRVYASTTSEETKHAYDGWAETYEADLYKAGYRLPTMIVATAARHIPVNSGPIVEGAAGTGIVAELLNAIGYNDITGFDLSEGMLELARTKNCYRSLHQMALGERLDFTDNQFSASLVTGAFTPGHAGPEGMSELVRITRPGGHAIFSIRVDGNASDPFQAMQDKIEKEGAWRFVERTNPIATMPLAEPEVMHSVFVYRVD